MKKIEKTISISEKKACIIGLIMSFIYSIIFSFLFANASIDILTDAGKIKESVSVLTIASLFIPILFVLFGILILGFIVVCSLQKQK